MQLYEIRQRPGRRAGVVTADTPQPAAQDTWYFSTQLEARQHFNTTKRHLIQAGFNATLDLSAITIQPLVTKADWIGLLEADAPGLRCSLTPQDFIKDRQQMAFWSSGPVGPEGGE